MIIPGLEARIGYAHQDTDQDMDIGHFNTWIAYNPDALTLAFEFDHFDFDGDSDLWDIMLMGNYQFTDFFGLTLRYTHEDCENLLPESIMNQIASHLLFFSLSPTTSASMSNTVIPGT